MKPGRRQRTPRIEPGSEGRMDYIEGGYSGSTGGGTVPGAGAMGRIHALMTTPTLGPGEDALFELDFAESCQLVEVSASLDCWIRVYNTAAARTADATRPIIKDPTPGEGVIGEVYPYAPDHLTIAWSPVPYFNNDDAPLTKKAYFAVKNMSLTTGPIDLDFTILPQEYVDPGGPQGDTGLPGRTLFILTAAPGAGLGQDGDGAFDKVAKLFYGPKSGGAWPTGVSLAGASGLDGKQLRYGSSDPTGSDGVDGEFFINTTSWDIFGPKASGAWPAGVSMIGAAGADGKNIRYGASDPTASDGVDGEFWINKTTWYIFGPKAAGAWPAGVSLVGPAGAGKIVNEVISIDSTVTSGSAQIPNDNTKPQISEGFQYRTFSYTPASASNILIVEALVNVYCGVQTGTILAVFVGAGPDADGIGIQVSPVYGHQLKAAARKVAGTTSPITISLRLGTTGSAQTIYTNRDNANANYGGSFSSYIKVTEVQP